MIPFETFLVPVDFSAHSDKALDHAIELAKSFGAKVHVLHAYHLPIQVATPDQIVIPQDFWTSVRDAAARKLEKALHKVTEAGLEGESHLSEMPAAQAIAQTAEKVGADLIIMGTRGLTGLKHVLLGSVAERTIRMAPCPVMTVKDISE
jgi:nucleotide-binding universal stress UspA family protein